MEIMKLSALILAIILILTACSPTADDFLSYEQKPFRAHLCWSSYDVELRAVLTSLPTDEGRSFTLEFSSPDSLDGAVVKKLGENVSLTLGELDIDSPHLRSLISVSDFFSIGGTLVDSAVEKIDGVEYNRVNVISADGTEYTVYLFSASGLPRRICGTLNGIECTLEVLSFELIS